MNYSKFSSRIKIRLERTLVALALGCSLTAGAGAAARAQERFTAWEIEQIRDAQELDRRIPVYLLIAQHRLIHLGLAEGDTERDDSPGPGKAVTFLIGIFQPNVAAEIERAAEEAEEAAAFEHDLTVFTPAELLGGYYQALDEAMDAIDDVYERRAGGVRGALENLRDYTEATIPLLRGFQPRDEDEEAALAEAVEQAETARDGAVRALEFIPKTEQDQ